MEYIGKDKAKSIALSDAGVSASNVRELEVELDKDENKYKFHYLNNCLEKYSLSEDELEIYIESIVTACVQSLPNEIKVEPKYIDGIVVAWTWYILIMFGSLFVKGIAIKILLQIVTTCFFVLWRKKKMRGE